MSSFRATSELGSPRAHLGPLTTVLYGPLQEASPLSPVPSRTSLDLLESALEGHAGWEHTNMCTTESGRRICPVLGEREFGIQLQIRYGKTLDAWLWTHSGKSLFSEKGINTLPKKAPTHIHILNLIFHVTSVLKIRLSFMNNKKKKSHTINF